MSETIIERPSVDHLLNAATSQGPMIDVAPPEQLTSQAPESSIDTASMPAAQEETIHNQAPEQLTSDAEMDEYGSKVVKPEKMYTKAEVDAMMRERIKSIKQGEAPQQVDTYNQNRPQQPMAQTNPEDPWEHQLESFIENTLSKREQKMQEQRMQQQALEAQTQFEIKFNQGMAKYPDFQEVITGKPLTPQMVLATRGMSDPAAFIYAAAKTQAKELERIAQIHDPYVQAVEVGQLAERMRKSRSTVSQAPRPIESPKGDVVDYGNRTYSIDERARMDAEKRFKMNGSRR